MAHRYWRVRITRANATTLTAVEIQLRATAGGANIAVGGVAAASSFIAGTLPASAFDGNTATFCNIVSSTTSMNEWISYDLGAGNDANVMEFTWLIGATASRNPRDCVLEFSDDNINWFHKWDWTDKAAAASSGTTVFTVTTDLELQETAVKAGFHIVQTSTPDDAVAVSKAAYQTIISPPTDSINVTKEGYFTVLQPIDGDRVAKSSSYVVFEQNEDARVATAKLYVIFRPIPPPPRKTIVIIGPGERFGGSGNQNPLIGTIAQEQVFSATMRLPHNLAGTIEQASDFTADLFVDNGSEDQFLEGTITQNSPMSATMFIPHNLAALMEQESPFTGDLTVDNATTPQYLEGTIEQVSIFESDLTIPAAPSSALLLSTPDELADPEKLLLSGDQGGSSASLALSGDQNG